MKFLRSVDNLSYSLASSQARIFEKSVSFGIPSKIFIKSFMTSNEALWLDNLNLGAAGLSEIEIFDEIGKKVNTKKGELFPFSVMHYIGYFYRMASYLTGFSSKELYKKIKPELLFRNYQTLHSLSIEEAIEEMFEIVNMKEEDKYSSFKKIYNMDL